jgi:SAM-dependent methyltransferase
MKNESQWKPSKYAVKGGKLRGTRDSKQLAVSSRLVTSLVVDAYNAHFLEHCRGRLLDLGCGKVPFYEFYRPRVEDIVCIDWEHTSHGAEHVDITCDLTGPLPLADASIDTVLLSSVLEHIPTPQALLHEIARVLTPGGKLILNVPFLYWLHETPHDYHRYTEYALRRMAEEARLQVIVLETIGGSSAVIGDILAKQLARIPGVGSLASRAAQGVCRGWLRCLAAHRRGRRARTRFPSGYFVVAQKQPA